MLLFFVNIRQNKSQENVRSYIQYQTFAIHCTFLLTLFVGAEPLKKLSTRIDAPSSRQPLVKGERLIRYEVSAAMLEFTIKLSI